MRFLVLVCLIVSSGCTPSALGPGGYAHPKHQYRVLADSSALLGDGWILDSHYSTGEDSYAAKSGVDWEVVYRLDPDGDGNPVTTELPRYDMLWEHESDSSAVWTRTVPIPYKFQRKDPRVLMLNYIERIANSGVTLATYEGSVSVESARYGTKIVNAGPVVVANKRAFAADIEVVNLNQYELDAATPAHRVRLVLVHHLQPLEVTYRISVPSVLLIGYSSRPSDFGKHEGVLHRFLGLVDLGAGTSPFSLGDRTMQAL